MICLIYACIGFFFFLLLYYPVILPFSFLSCCATIWFGYWSNTDFLKLYNLYLHCTCSFLYPQGRTALKHSLSEDWKQFRNPQLVKIKGIKDHRMLYYSWYIYCEIPEPITQFVVWRGNCRSLRTRCLLWDAFFCT